MFTDLCKDFLHLAVQIETQLSRTLLYKELWLPIHLNPVKISHKKLKCSYLNVMSHDIYINNTNICMLLQFCT